MDEPRDDASELFLRLEAEMAGDRERDLEIESGLYWNDFQVEVAAVAEEFLEGDGHLGRRLRDRGFRQITLVDGTEALEAAIQKGRDGLKVELRGEGSDDLYKALIAGMVSGSFFLRTTPGYIISVRRIPPTLARSLYFDADAAGELVDVSEWRERDGDLIPRDEIERFVTIGLGERVIAETDFPEKMLTFREEFLLPRGTAFIEADGTIIPVR